MNLHAFGRFVLTSFLLVTTIGAFAQRKGYWEQNVDYKIIADVDVTKDQYNGQMSLIYSNNSGQNLEKVYFHLYFNAFQPGSMMDYRLSNIADPDRRMVTNIGTKEKPVYESRIAKLKEDQIGFQKIKSVKMDAQNATFKVDGTLLEVSLPKAISSGKKATFQLEWTAQVPEQIRRSGKNSNEGVALSMAQWYPKMAQFDEFGWHLDEYVGREFIAPFGNFDVTVYIDPSYVLGASGVLQNPNEVKGYSAKAKIKTQNGKAKWHFKAQRIHDFVWAADPKFEVDSTKSNGGIRIYTIYLPETKDKISTKENWKTALGYVSQFFDYTGAKFGPYPWPTYSIIQGGDGGMEYGTATLVTGGRDLKSLVGVIFHEASHSWYQHLFGINETVDEWFDEGFTTYLEENAMHDLYTKDRDKITNPVLNEYNAYIRLALSGKEEPMSLLADYYDTNYAYSNEAYSKGAVLAEQLGYIIGEQQLEKTFLKFYEVWKFKHPTPNDLKRVAEDISGMNLKWYFNLFLNTTRRINYGISAVEGNKITLKNNSNFAMPLDVLVTYKDGSSELFYIPLREMRGEKPAENFPMYQNIKRTTLEDWFWTKPVYEINCQKEVSSVSIDPTLRLADVDRNDNVYPVVQK